MTKTTDYVGNKVYENNALKRILVDGGYYESGNYYFYIQDHLGNNRIVANAAASVVQSMQYYPFGMPFADATAPGLQPYKYNDKELDTRNGLNQYDYSARWKDDWRFTTIDPLAEKYYSWSPYAYVMNNPMKYIDPDGCDTVYAYKDGTEFDRIKAKGDDVTIYGPSQDMIAEGSTSTSSFMPIFTYGFGVGGAATNTYACLHYTQRPWGTGYFQTSRGNYYSLSALKPDANGKFVKGVQGLRYGALYAQKSVRIPSKIGTGMSYVSLLASGYNFSNNQSLSNGIDFGVSLAGIVYWEVAVPYVYFQFIGQPGIDQIQENIKTNQHPLNNTINPTTGEYYVPGHFNGFGF